MSVINKVLQDLDKRQQPHKFENVQTVSTTSTQSNRSSVLIWTIGLLFAVIIVGAVGMVYLLNPALFSTEQQKPVVIAAVNKTKNTVMSDGPIAELALEAIASSIKQIEQQLVSIEDKKTSDIQVIEPLLELKSALKPELKQESKVESKLEPEPEPVLTPRLLPQIQTKPKPTLAVIEKPQATLEIKPVELTSQQLADKFYKQGELAVTQGQADKAIASFERTLSFDNGYHQARKQLAALYFGRKQNNKAITLLQTARQQFPQYSEYSLMLAKIYISNEQYDNAMQMLGNIPETDDLAPEKWMQLGTIAQQQKKYDKAVTAFKKLTAHRPSEGRWWLGLGFNLDAQQQYVAAKSAYQNALNSHSLSKASIQYIQQRLLQISKRAK